MNTNLTVIRSHDVAKVAAVLPSHMLGLSANEVLKQATVLAKANGCPLIEAMKEVLQGVSYLHACVQAQTVLDR